MLRSYWHAQRPPGVARGQPQAGVQLRARVRDSGAWRSATPAPGALPTPPPPYPRQHTNFFEVCCTSGEKVDVAMDAVLRHAFAIRRGGDAVLDRSISATPATRLQTAAAAFASAEAEQKGGASQFGALNASVRTKDGDGAAAGGDDDAEADAREATLANGDAAQGNGFFASLVRAAGARPRCGRPHRGRRRCRAEAGGDERVARRCATLARGEGASCTVAQRRLQQTRGLCVLSDAHGPVDGGCGQRGIQTKSSFPSGSGRTRLRREGRTRDRRAAWPCLEWECPPRLQ